MGNSRIVVVCSELDFNQLHELEKVIEAQVQKMRQNKMSFATIVKAEYVRGRK